MIVLGFSGHARSGKTTAADYIEREYGIARVHIATTLRKMLAEMLRDLGLSEQRIWDHLEGPLKEEVIPEVGKSGRTLQIRLGTEFGRRMIRDDLWVDTWSHIVRRRSTETKTIPTRDSLTGRFSSVPANGSMNDSVRFPNEERGIRDLGGFTILITRPGTGPIAFKWGRLGRFLHERFRLIWGAHDSERTDRLKPDYTIVNDGSIADLHRDLDAIMEMEGVARLKAVA